MIEPQFLGRMEIKEGATFEFLCSEGRLLLTMMGPDIVRVQIARRNMNYRDRPSYSRVPLMGACEVSLSQDDGCWTFTASHYTLHVQFNPLRLTMKDSEGHLLFDDVDDGGLQWRDEGFVCQKRMLGDECFYGMGEKAHGLNKRGLRYEMWNTDNPEYGPDSDPLYQSIPFFIVLRDGVAHGVFLDNSYRSFFDFGHTQNDRYSFGAPGGPVDYYIILGPRISDVLDGYTRLTGRPHFAPRWALGHQHSRWMEYESQDELLEIARAYRARRIPCDTIVLDIAYMDEFRIFTWDPHVFPDPQAFTEAMRGLGFRVMAIMDPGVKVDEDYFMYREGVENDYFLKRSDGSLYIGLVWPGETVFPEFSRREVREWFASKYAILAQTRLSNSSWIDMNEPSNCIYAGLREEYSMENVVDQYGEPWEERLRNVYGLNMAEAAFMGLKRSYPGERPFILTRSGFAGYQRFAATWTGDNRSEWPYLHLSIPMLLNLGLSGVPMCGADVGGFFGDVSKELFVRWYQLGCFYPFFRNHSCISASRREPWLFGKQVESIVREYVNLRYSFLRYLYSLLWHASQTGCPMMRPLVMEFQDDSDTYSLDTEFMLGPYILVAPILEEGATQREVYLPRGVWFSLWDDTRTEGPARIDVEASLERIPVFVRGGSVIPVGSVVQSTDEYQGDLVLWVYPGGSSTFVLFEDNGVSDTGPMSTVKFSLSDEHDSVKLDIGPRIGEWKPPQRDLVVQIHGVGSSVARVLVDGRTTDVMKHGTISEFRMPDDGDEHHIIMELA
ncbi:MAG: TIM-barrel domain-containing protein [Candidatus Thorarchaeota archaeon]